MARLSKQRAEFMNAIIRACPEFNYMHGDDHGDTVYVFNHRIVTGIWRAYAYKQTEFLAAVILANGPIRLDADAMQRGRGRTVVYREK